MERPQNKQVAILLVGIVDKWLLVEITSSTSALVIFG